MVERLHLAGSGAISSGSPPASSTACQGSVSSTCSTPSLATRKATRLPSIRSLIWHLLSLGFVLLTATRLAAANQRSRISRPTEWRRAVARPRRAPRRAASTAPARLIREICICETPRRSADLLLGELVDEAHPQHLPLALVEAGACRGELGLDPVVAGLRAADRLDRRARVLVVVRARGASSERVRRAWPASSASSTSSTEISRRSAISVGGREPARAPRSGRLVASSTFIVSSCRPRGRRTFQTWSRKWRRSSPRIVGTA